MTPLTRRGLPVALAAVAAIFGTIVALHYHQLDLTLSHYDARGHLVVARRIVDSMTPGWQQIGAVWLPLPHLLNMLPVQVDAWYQSGASGVAISIAAFAVAVGAIASIILQLTASPVAAAAGAAVFALNPNVLYLQATPMTEPLLIGLTTLGVAMLLNWTTNRGREFRPLWLGWVLALACLTRYEAWPITAAALAAAWWALWRQGEPSKVAAHRVGAIALFPVVAIAGFVVFSRVVIGQWFVAGGFFVPENKALGDPLLATAEIWYGLSGLSGPIVLMIGTAGILILAGLGLTRVRWSPALIAVSLAASSALPWVAFFEGHPFRIRYMAPLIAAEAAGVGCALGLAYRALAGRSRGVSRLASGAAILGVFIVIGSEMRPLDRQAPMVLEAQWDRPNVPFRARVTACLGAPQPGQKIMASMGSLGHYMQETASAGFELRDFLHEGNGDIWLAALAEGPRLFAEWVLIEEKAEGGDMLAMLARERPHFLHGYERACEGAGIVLYKRQAARRAEESPAP